jgi:hypothetical protein
VLSPELRSKALPLFEAQPAAPVTAATTQVIARREDAGADPRRDGRLRKITGRSSTKMLFKSQLHFCGRLQTDVSGCVTAITYGEAKKAAPSNHEHAKRA